MGRPELGLPELQHRERAGRGHLLVLRGGDRGARLRGRTRGARGELAMRVMPRMEREEPTLLLVLLPHPHEGPEAACVGRKGQ